MFNTDVKLFEIQLPKIEAKPLTAIIVSGCNAYLGEGLAVGNRVYSEWEENNYAYQNNNDFNGKVFELEVCLYSHEKIIYSSFYARCFSIRTDNGVTIKKNGFKNDKHFTKMNMNNEVVIGLGWFLTDEQYELLRKTKLIMIEGFFAMNKVTNTYGVAVQLVKNDDKYEIQFANTYRMDRRQDINGLAH